MPFSTPNNQILNLENIQEVNERKDKYIIISNGKNFLITGNEKKIPPVLPVRTKKLQPDYIEDGKEEYDHSITQIEVTTNDGYDCSKNTLLSIPQQAIVNGSPIIFDKAALEVCEQLTTGTHIDYFLRACDQTEAIFSDWIKVTPVNTYSSTSRKSAFSSIANFGNTTKTSLTNLQITTGNYLYSYSDFPDLGSVRCLTTALSTYSTTLLLDTLVLYRNVGVKYGSYSTDVRVSVRDAPVGWRLVDNDTCYETTVIVYSSTGYPIDLGEKPAWINGIKTTGRTTIPAGVRTFKTLIEATSDVDPSYTGYSTEDSIKEDDPFYPYNHKAIIEGIIYNDDYKGVKRYQGVDLYCEFICKRINPFDLINNTRTENLGFYAINANNGEILIRIDPDDSEYLAEVFNCEYKDESSGWTKIQLKAEFFTDEQNPPDLDSQNPNNDVNKTPFLQAYRIKLGV